MGARFGGGCVEGVEDSGMKIRNVGMVEGLRSVG